MKPIININDIAQLSKQLHHQGKRIVLVGGCFDLLHYGHIALFEKAKKQGDCLVVLLESDRRIQELKGTNRPIHTQMQRAHMLMALKTVDYVICLPEAINNDIYDMVVNQLQPAIIATTRGSDSVRHIARQAKVNNATVYFVDPIGELSTSRIVEAIQKEL